jgi:ubiquinone/menaquinone biosynthesis C-methylase UbiE
MVSACTPLFFASNKTDKSIITEVQTYLLKLSLKYKVVVVYYMDVSPTITGCRTRPAHDLAQDGVHRRRQELNAGMSEQETITQAFTELAPSYQRTMDQELSQFWGISYHDFVEKMLATAQVRPGEWVLDIATGTAFIPKQLKERMPGGRPIFGLDITQAMLQTGRRELLRQAPGSPIELVCASAMAMPFASGIFDIAICALGTHHMDVPLLLSEARRVLVDGGRLVISDVGATPFWRSALGKLVLWGLMAQYGLANHSARSQAEIEAFKNVRTASEWSHLLEELGFRNIQVDEIRPRYPWYPSGLTMTAKAE